MPWSCSRGPFSHLPSVGWRPCRIVSGTFRIVPPPTSTTVEVRRLAHPDMLVEIEVVAVVG